MNQEENILAKRLNCKNDSHTLIQNLITRYSLSIAAAEALNNEVRTHFVDSSFLEDGQEYFTAISIDEPAGKPLKLCKTIRIKLTVRSKQDLQIRVEHGIRGLMKNTISRVCWQALKQNALLTQEDLAFLLNVSRATIKRLLKQIKLQNDYIPTRGNYHDIGPGISHKYEAVKLYIKGLEPSAIAMRMGHALNCIERYIENFSLVVAASIEDYSSTSIARFTGINEKTVKEYLILYDRYSLDDNLKPFLDKLIHDFRERKLLKKNNKKKENKHEIN